MTKIFASTRLAFFLIAFILLLIVLSAIIPQKDTAAGQMFDWQKLLGDNYSIIQTLKLDQIYESPYFFILLGLLGINLIFGNIRRFRIIYKTDKNLIKARHIGSIIFHLSLVLIMSGIILNYLYRFDGVLAITEGQSVVDKTEAYTHIFKGPLYNDPYGRFEITNNKFYTDYNINNTQTTAAEISLKDSPIAPKTTNIIATNFPLRFNGLEFHYGRLYGYAPEILLLDSLDNILFKSFVRVAVQEQNNKKIYADYIIIPQTGHKISIKVLPNYQQKDSTFFNLMVEKDTEILYEGTVGLNDTVTFDTFKMTVPRLRYWCYINVVKSPFLKLVFISFWTAIIGLTIGFIPRVIGERKKNR